MSSDQSESPIRRNPVVDYWLSQGLFRSLSHSLATHQIKTWEQVRELGRDGVLSIPGFGKIKVDALAVGASVTDTFSALGQHLLPIG